MVPERVSKLMRAMLQSCVGQASGAVASIAWRVPGVEAMAFTVVGLLWEHLFRALAIRLNFGGSVRHNC